MLERAFEAYKRVAERRAVVVASLTRGLARRVKCRNVGCSWTGHARDDDKHEAAVSQCFR